MTQNIEIIQAETVAKNNFSNEFIIYLLQVTGDPEFRLKAISARKKGVKAEFIPEGWVYKEKKDAEEVANRWTNGKRIIHVIPWYSPRCSPLLNELWNGSKSKSDLAKKSLKLELDSYQLNKKRKEIELKCYRSGLHHSWLHREQLPEDMSEQEKNAFGLFKPLWNLASLEKENIDLRESDIARETEDLEEIEISNLINPEKWPFVVLGLNYNMEILLSYNGRIMKWPVERLGESRIKALFGQNHSDWEETRDAIIYKAHNRGMIDDETPIKSGVWKFDKKWLVISGKRAVVIENGVFKNLEFPVFEGKLIEFENADWLDWNTFTASFEKENISEVFQIVFRKILSWNWINPSMPYYATSFVFISPFQQAMIWRPWVYLTGAKGTGKSSFFDNIMQAIFGNNTERLDKSTAHATAQTIGNTGKIPIFDEFEKHRHIPEVMEMAKLFNKGGRKTSGTPGQKANIYDFHHMAWFGSIYLPRHLGQDAAQESRMVKLELKKLKDDTPLLEKVDDKEGKMLSGQIVGAMIKNWEEIERRAAAINEKRKDIIADLKKSDHEIEIRTVENFMYASALLCLVDPENQYTVPEWAARNLEDDADKILNTILYTIIKIGSDSYTVAEALNSQNQLFPKELEKLGLKFTTNNGIKYLAIKCETAMRYLLRDSDFRDKDIQAPLSRIDGAKGSVQVKGLNKCVLIPINSLNFE